MAGQGPIEVVDTNALGALLSNEMLLAGFSGMFAGFIGAAVLPITPVVGGVGAFLVVAGAIAGAAVVNRTSKQVQLYDDRIELTKGKLGFTASSADYGDVELVVRKTTKADAVFGTETFKLIRSTSDNLDLRYLEDSDTVARILDERMTPPAEQLEASTRGSRHRDLWHHWPDDTEPPASSVVEDEKLADDLDVDASDLKLDDLEAAEAHDDFGDLSDFGDVAGDIGGGGDGGVDGGGFDGGGGDGGGGGGGGSELIGTVVTLFGGAIE